MKSLPAVRIEGGLFAPDLLDQLLAEALPGQKPRDFGLDPRRRLTDEIAAIFADASALWRVFRHRLEQLPPSDTGTTLTRDMWAIPFLRLLGYELHYNRNAYIVEGLTFAISHRAGEDEHAPPVHIVSARQDLGRRAPGGRPRLAPHSLVQEYLNRTDALWGLVTNGKIIRLLRDSTYIRRQSYVEFDLEAIFEQHLFQDFAVLYRLLHRSRLPRSAADAPDCLLEQYYQHSLEQGSRVRDRLRDGVEACIQRLANGFLAHPRNQELRQRIRLDPQDPHHLSPPDLYRQFLRLVYRFLFLLVAEDRGLISAHPLYRDHYGVARLRAKVDNRSEYTDDVDLWHSLRALWHLLGDDTPQADGRPLAAWLDLPVLDGELFQPLDLDGCRITNRDLLDGLWYLVNYRESPAQPPRRVHYAALDVEELGSIYESLLDYHPHIHDAGGSLRFELAFGSERKSTGSYYTPAELVAELIHSALEPVMHKRLTTATPAERERALLAIRVCDPACGSGHFLLAAARRMGLELARIRSGEEEPAPEAVREAVRDVVAHCIYGVDKNPLAVELCKVALWLEAHTPGKPLTFLDHRIKCGDSLVGVFDLEALKAGVPDDAFKPVSGDDRKIASSLKRQNKQERAGQIGLFGWSLNFNLDGLAQRAAELEAIPDDSPAAVRRKRQLYEQRTADPDWQRQKLACDLWTAAFFQPYTPALARSSSPPLITTDVVRRALAGGHVPPQAAALAQALAAEHRFFHWPLEFPEIFAPSPLSPGERGEGKPPQAAGVRGEGGFDVILGNPPWEQVQFDDREFFAVTAPDIVNAQNMAQRKKAIERLKTTNPALHQAYLHHKSQHDKLKGFIHASGRYPLTSFGRLNLAPLFAELSRQLINSYGKVGIIVPTGIATDSFNQYFFADLVERGQLVSLFDFENREAIFPGVHRSYKFCLLTLRGANAEGHAAEAEFVFFATNTAHLRDPRRRFTLTPADIARINPNTRTLPVFRTRQDAELTRAIYARVPVLVDERTGENPWGVRFKLMFMMNTDSHLFRTREQLEAQGYRLVGNRFVPPTPSPSPAREGGEERWEVPEPLRRRMVEIAREFRKNPTRSEAILWEALRGRQLDGVKFRRQQNIGPFVVDFYAPSHRLVVEVDGGVHLSQRERDRERQALLESLGLRFVRLPAELVEQDLPRALEIIRRALHSPSSPLVGEGGRGGEGAPLSPGGRGAGGEGAYLPLYEAKMIWHYDHRYGTYAGVDSRSSTQLPNLDDRQHADPAALPLPWYWVDAREVGARLGGWERGWLLGFRNVTNATNERTAIFSLFPRAGVGNSLPVMLLNELPTSYYAALYGNFVSLAFDWVARQKLAGVNMNFFYVQQFPVLLPSAYTPEDLRFIVPRVLELTYTAWDLKPFADDVWQDADDALRAAIQVQWEANRTETGGHAWELPDWIAAYPEIETDPAKSCPLPPFKWDESRRARLQAELDACYARLYGLTRKQLRYILDPADLTPRELEDILDPWEEVDDPLDPTGYAERVAASDFPGETFRVLKEKEIRQYGEYRTRRLVLEAWERLGRG